MACVGLAPCGAAWGDNEEEAEAALERAVASFEDGDYDDAIEEAGNVIELAPESVQGYRLRGIAYTATEDYELAITDLTRSIEIEPDDAMAFTVRGSCWFRIRDYDKGFADCNTAIELEPTFAFPLLGRAEGYGIKGDYDKALLDCNKAIEIDPELYEAYGERGSIYDLKGDYRKAMEDFNKAIELEPYIDTVYRGRGLSWYDQGDYRRASADFARAIDLMEEEDPDIVYARVFLYLAKARQGQNAKSILRETKDILRKGKEISEVVKMFLGEITPEACLAAAVDKNPRLDKEKKCEGYYYVGCYRLLHGDKDGAKKMFEACIATEATGCVESNPAKVELKRMEEASKAKEGK